MTDADLPLTYTWFPDTKANSKTEYADVPLSKFFDKIKNATTYKSKASCPLIALAEYGDSRNPSGCLRHDENVVRIFGVETDYDAGLVPLAEGARRLQAANLVAILHTSGSHTKAKPRWRAFAPLSEAAAPGMKREFLGRVNRALGGIIARESFDLSRTYYVGRVKGVDYEFAQTTGRTVDLAADLEPLYPAGDTAPGPNGANGARPRDQTTDAELRAAFVKGEGRFEAMKKLSSRWAARGMSAADIEAALLEMLGAGTHNGDGIDLRTRVRPLADSAVRKFGETRRGEKATTDQGSNITLIERGTSAAALGIVEASEDAIALAFAERFQSQARFCHTTGAWFTFTGTHWHRDGSMLAFSWARDLCRELNVKGVATLKKTATASAIERAARSDRPGRDL